MTRAAIALVAIAFAAGCGDDPPEGGIHSPDGVMIRDWLMAVAHYDFSHAAEFFAPGAIIDQGHPFRLPDAAAAREFNAGLPCHAKLIGLEEEDGPKVLATFRLSPGPGGACKGKVQVRYTIRDGKFTEWRQLRQAGRGPTV
jgi:hypothetical protein